MIEIAPLIKIAPFHGTSLLLIILLSLKAGGKSVLHFVNFQSYPLSIESSSLQPLLRSPSPNPIGHPSPS